MPRPGCSMWRWIVPRDRKKPRRKPQSVQHVLTARATKDIVLALYRSAREREEETRRDRRDRAVQKRVDLGFSVAVARHRPDVADAWLEQEDPYSHGLTPPFSDRRSGKRRRRPRKPYRDPRTETPLDGGYVGD